MIGLGLGLGLRPQNVGLGLGYGLGVVAFVNITDLLKACCATLKTHMCNIKFKISIKTLMYETKTTALTSIHSSQYPAAKRLPIPSYPQ